MVVVEDGESVSAVHDRIDDVLASHPDATVMNQEEFEGALGGVIDQLLTMVTALLLLAVLIALLGIVNTLALSVFERTRELGMLRAVGMTRGQVRSMVRWESVVISTIGALLGPPSASASGWPWPGRSPTTASTRSQCRASSSGCTCSPPRWRAW
jgi:putative ABC transport system permease protein